MSKCAVDTRCAVVLAALMAGCSGVVASPSGPAGAGGVDSPNGGLGSDQNGALPGSGAGVDQPFEAAPSALRKLTVLQYRNSVRDLLGPDIKLPEELENDTAVNGFYAIGAAKATISPFAAEKFENAAYALAAQVLDTAHRKSFVVCTPAAATDKACSTEVIKRFGLQAFRRPLSDEELTRYVALAEQAQKTLGDFYEGLQYAVAGLLQSPHFLFRVELGAADEALTMRPYDGYEMASRLSYMLWNSTPDAELLAAAARGELATLAGLEAQADRLLAAPRAKVALADFHTERLSLDLLQTLEKDAKSYAGLDDTLRKSMLNDVLATIEELTFGSETDFRQLFDTRVSFVDTKLAAIYALPAVTGTKRVELPANGNRLGLLGKAAFLASAAHNDTTSPTLRGKFIRERLLCQSIAAPPPEVATVLPQPDPNAPTMRARLKVHAENASCNVCHKEMDPMGLSLEHFDTIGRYRADDQGHTLDTTGNLDGTPFDGAIELSTLLRDDPRTSECVVRQVYRYAVAHVETAGEAPVVATLINSFQQSGYRLTELLRAVVTSDGFRFSVGE